MPTALRGHASDPCPRKAVGMAPSVKPMILFLDTNDPARGETLLTLVRAHWPLWATAALAFAGIYALLPNARRSKPIWAGFIAASAILLAGIWFVNQDGVWPEQVLFYAFALLAIVGGVMMLAQSNPVH